MPRQFHRRLSLGVVLLFIAWTYYTLHASQPSKPGINEAVPGPDEVLERVKYQDAETILNAIDASGLAFKSRFAGRKGELLGAVIAQHRPQIVIEFGTYIGLSTVRIARSLAPGSVLYTIDADARTQAVAERVVAYAGLSAKVRFILESSEAAIPGLYRVHGVSSGDLYVFDQHPSSYLHDLSHIEDLGLLHAGTVLVANIIGGDEPADYLAHVRNSDMCNSSFLSAATSAEDSLPESDGLELTVVISQKGG